MAAPSAALQVGPGASGHNDNVAIGTFQWPTTENGGAEDYLFIHCGFVPKIFFLKNETESANSCPAIMWFNVLPGDHATGVFSAIDLSSGAYIGPDEGVMGWDSSVTASPNAGQGGGPPDNYGWGVVPTGFYYIKENTAALSGGFVQDVIIGVKIKSVTYQTQGDYQILGTDADVFHYVAIG